MEPEPKVTELVHEAGQCLPLAWLRPHLGTETPQVAGTVRPHGCF